MALKRLKAAHRFARYYGGRDALVSVVTMGMAICRWRNPDIAKAEKI